ncbi:MAG: hypothetical protein JWO15_3876 [Sphingomonadales bacterium]|nr:hypothetical protein [Sphingomonadales bacterium]
MSREWKPGDVALVMGADEKWRKCLRAITNDGWYDEDGAHDADDEVHHVRPLVVIDPADRDQRQALGDSLMRHGIYNENDSCSMQGALGDALRSLLAPPKPPEPMGLGAVVEDSRGEMWIRDKTTTTVNHWKRARGEDGGSRYSWDHLTAVRVLSEGVQP